MTKPATDAAARLTTLLTRLAEDVRAEDVNAEDGRTADARTDDRPGAAAGFGAVSVECAIAAVAGDRPGVVRGSAAFMEALFRLWAEQDLDPEAVWNELHARIEMGELSLRLSRAPGRHRTRRVGPWRVATSKLP
ncbi:phosphoribosyl-ATP pyrophosphatase [Acetobacter musti]|uniref:Phosphoribosyl-ATP pyrophosphatase n=1 Tax=Acetobacter musti TaxID=864732 RepID=A0ABX0JNU7_9PROT|nr:phosphoribosyl-ATP pyrophosphatase [Acetobacter musti]NHN84917.1 phosphoribosyl-ATP pyrophosphatase [Acetobacter musti]